MFSVQALLKEGASHFPQISKRQLRVLLAHLMQTSFEFLMAHPETEVSSEVARQFLRETQKLLEGMPLSRLLGKREFWGMDFALSEATLDPRPESEILIEAVLKHCLNRGAPLKVLDLGTGTGCLIISILTQYPNAEGMAVDQSAAALEMTQKNADTHGVADRLKYHHGDWFEGVKGTFDIIISNPPYISDQDYERLDKNVKDYDPKKALVAGEEGLDCYKIIIPAALNFLPQNGILALEIGYGQHVAVQRLMEEASFKEVQLYPDLAGIGRCVVGRK